MANRAFPATLLMSATIAPPQGMPGSVRSDPTIRSNDYIEALSFYAGISTDFIGRILFLENSDSDLTPLKRSLPVGSSKKVEFISTDSHYSAEKGKGFGEFLMIDRGLEVAKSFLRSEDRIWKVTGRIKVQNIAMLIATAPEDYEVYCDLRRVPLIGESLGGNRWMELRVFSCTLGGYDLHFRSQYDKAFVLEKFFFERLFGQITSGNSSIKPRFFIQPKLDGHSGFSNANYRSSQYKAKEGLRIICRKLVPDLWL